MTESNVLANRLVERIFGSKRKFTQQELEAQTPPPPPRSVIAQLEDGRNQRAASREFLRKLRRF